MERKVTRDIREIGVFARNHNTMDEYLERRRELDAADAARQREHQRLYNSQFRRSSPSTRYNVRPNYRWWICQRLGIDCNSDYEPRPFYRGLPRTDENLAPIAEEPEDPPRGAVWRLNSSFQVVLRKPKPATDYSPPNLEPYTPLWDSVAQVLETPAAQEVSRTI